MSDPEAFYRQAIDLNRYSNHVALNVMRAYNNIVVDAATRLNSLGSLTPTEVVRLNTLLLQVKESLATWAGDSSVYLMQELQGLALLENEFIVDQIKSVVKPGLVDSVRSVEITPDFAKAVVMSDPTDLNAAVAQSNLQEQIEGIAPGTVTLDASKGEALLLPNGRNLNKSFRQLAEASAEKFRMVVQNGILTGETMEDMVKQLLGNLRFDDASDILRTIAKGGGLTTLSDSQIRALIRTAVTQISSTVDNQVYFNNQDLISSYRYSATLDLRTTAICRSLDGRVFKFGKGPEPPQHFGCRSRMIMITRSEAEGDIKDRGTRAALGGLVPADQKYGSWLAGLTKQQQDEALGGERKGDIFRNLLKKESGDTAIRKFVSSDGSELTLKDLQRKYGTT